METIAERASEYANNEWAFKIHYIAEESYIAGAKEQKVIDIDKTCEWLKENIEGGVHSSSTYGFVEKFRKAMEE